MFRHKGKGRTYLHNLKLASALSGVAGIVNIVGVLSVSTLTTNVTGHFAFFSEQLFLGEFHKALVFLLYIGCFLSGAFASSLLMEWSSKHTPRTSYVAPILLEVLLITSASVINRMTTNHFLYTTSLAGILLFAMGLQNALVTRVSQSIVRTTHLTGLFTDLGIELSQLFFYREKSQLSKLRKSIFLRMMIISGFFLGGIVGGFFYLYFGLNTLFFPVGLLLFALLYDNLLFRYYLLKRKIRDHWH